MAIISDADREHFRKHTIESCIVNDTIVDSPNRDRAIWAEDLYVSGPAATKYIPDGQKYWKNTLLAIASRQYKSGKLPACLEVSLEYRPLSAFSDTAGMWWAISSYDYLKRTNDRVFRDPFITTLKKLLDFYTTHIDKDGIYRCSLINFEGDWTILRPRRSALANVLFYRLLRIAESFSVKVPISSDEFKKRFHNIFWSEAQGAFVDSRNVIFLDANALSVTFGLVGPGDIEKIFRTPARFETLYGPVTYIGSPRHISHWHTDLVSPFAAHLYVKALIACGRVDEARRNYNVTIDTAISIARTRQKNTLPEFWKRNGTIWTAPATHPLQWRVSYCHGWSTFGGLSFSEISH